MVFTPTSHDLLLYSLESLQVLRILYLLISSEQQTHVPYYSWSYYFVLPFEVLPSESIHIKLPLLRWIIIMSVVAFINADDDCIFLEEL